MVPRLALVSLGFLLVAMVRVHSQEEEGSPDLSAGCDDAYCQQPVVGLTPAPKFAMWPVTAVAGRSTDLPCYLNPRTPGDRPKLILWYKRGVRTPVYSYDDRTAQQHFGIRDEGVGLTSRGAATITIKRVLAESAGLYECRVDFFRSPTHNSFVNLTVIGE
ncbi:uncharacterized protein LOC122264834 [Penaeus japonicus]|uniref:uncharacterized protein LOC122264834 n=1 Tax=Penaeus japonicus TaxID=27405 RepID=UPI001C70DF22|nr:uncharacterized protein LOC122264834 [Penaeus japonicus]